jgi:hypothetical protein
MMKIIKNIAVIFFLSMTLTLTGVAHPGNDGGDFFQRRDKSRERPREGDRKPDRDRGDRDRGDRDRGDRDRGDRDKGGKSRDDRRGGDRKRP